MSRIGKTPIAIPSGVEVKVAGSTVTVKGPKGESAWDIPSVLTVAVEDNQVIVDRTQETKMARSLHGTIRSVINNMVIGVDKGYVKELEISGV
ncbi:MAG: 50S ribosomal protein L6, partial [Kiritimatiellaceae bacterium]|nr:50S ribosomal protein L6 [Kiritimatiellaceae bacterium]